MAGMTVKVGFIGVGNMGGALARSIVKGDTEKRFSLSACDTNKVLLDELTHELPIQALADARAVVSQSDIIMLCVKPQVAEIVLNTIKDVFDGKKLLVSIIVGLPISFYKKILGENIKVVRTMPNTPALVGAGMTLVSWDSLLTQEDKSNVIELLGYSGLVEELDEKLMSEVTALTGSSPAYVFMMIEAMADAAVQSGIPRKISYKLASQAVLGSAQMVLETGRHPGELKDMVCSPAGTTIEAVAALERTGFRNAILTAMNECTQKAREIGRKYT